MNGCHGIAGVVLAAGGARRMQGRLKQLLPCQGETLVHRAARVALEAGLTPVWVVVGAGAAAVEAAVADLPVLVLKNPQWTNGQSTSVRVAVQALQANEASAAVFLLADQPFVPPALIQALCRAATTSDAPIITPAVDGQRANPVLIRARLFPLLANLTGDTGARALFDRFPPAAIKWHDPQVRVALDTPEDYRRWCPEGQAEATSAGD